MHEARAQPRRDEVGLGVGDGIEQGERTVGLGKVEQVWVVAGGGVVDETLDDVVSAMSSRELEGTDPQMTRRDAHQHRARKNPFPLDAATRGDDRQRPGGGDAQGVHRLGDQVFAQHRTQRG